MTEFKKGDRVWFISKFGNKVTGVYEGMEDMSWGTGMKSVHIVVSYDAFGDKSDEPTSCIVANGLHHLNSGVSDATGTQVNNDWRFT